VLWELGEGCFQLEKAQAFPRLLRLPILLFLLKRLERAKLVAARRWDDELALQWGAFAPALLPTTFASSKRTEQR